MFRSNESQLISVTTTETFAEIGCICRDIVSQILSLTTKEERNMKRIVIEVIRVKGIAVEA